MRYHVLLPSLLTLGAFGLVACGEETTQPNTAEDRPDASQLAVTSNTWLTRRDMPLELIDQATAVAPNAAGKSILYAIGGAKASSRLPGARSQSSRPLATIVRPPGEERGRFRGG